jgi:putative peptidoglycan lipid II flippase
LIRFFGSRLDAGNITLLALGNKLMGLPVLLIGSAIGLALLPTASIHFGEDDPSGATRQLVQAFSCALLLICPIAVLYLNLSPQIVSIVFRHGAITAAQLVELGRILQAYAGATVGLTLVYVLASFMGALRQGRELIGTGILTVSFNAFLMRRLVVAHGAVGIAAAVSIGSIVYCMVLLLLLARRLGPAVCLRLLRSTVLISVGGLGMQVAIMVTRELEMCPSSPWLGRAIIPAAAALIPYAAWVTLHRRRIALTQI